MEMTSYIVKKMMLLWNLKLIDFNYPNCKDMFLKRKAFAIINPFSNILQFMVLT